MTSNRKLLTLVLIVDDAERKILLGMKKRGFGQGRWNGFGGKVLADETTDECAVRETQEECGLTMIEYFKIGHMVFEFVGDPVLLDVSVFRCDKYSGDIVESDEMRPQWFSFEDIPFKDMWPDDYLWYPHVFRQKKFSAKYLFEGHDTILKHDIKLVESF